MGGETLLYTGNPILAGAAGGLTTNVATQGLESLSGKRSCFSWRSAAVDTGVGALTGYLPGLGKLLPGRSIRGVAKSQLTKLQHGSTRNLSARTAAKILAYQTAEGIPGAGAGAAAGLPINDTVDECRCQ